MPKKIGFKLILAVGITTMIIIGVYAFYTIRAQSDVLISEVERHVNQLSETVKNSTRYDMLLNQRDRISQVVSTIGKEQYIHNVRILNKVGSIIYSSKGEEIGKMVDRKTESCYVCHAADQPLEHLGIEQRTRIFTPVKDSGRILAVINPIYNEPSCWKADCHAHSSRQTVLGVLDVAISLREVDDQIAKSKMKAIYFAVIAILALSIIIGWFVRKWVDKPVKDLVKGTNSVAVGNLNYVIQNPRNDELGELAKSFNNMTKKLAETRLQLLQSGKLASVGRLAAGVAHEINNPLTGVLTYSSFLQKRTKDQPELQQDLDVIVRETKRCREIVKGLLDFSRQSTPKKNLINIRETIEQTLAVVTNQLSLSHVTLVKNFCEDCPQVQADENQLQQVFLNLIVNAIDAIGSEGGTLTISSSVTEYSPYGVRQMKQAFCPNKHSLIDNDHRIEGMPTIKIKAKFGNNEGFIHLDPIYGRRRNHYGISFPKDKGVTLFCPECNESLLVADVKCPECKSAVFAIREEEGSVLYACSNFECSWQKWEAVDIAGKQKYIEIKVADTGCGIPAENLNKIFEPFFTTKDQRGTGLGLSIIWGILDNHNGKISVQSEVGKGTVFTITLPAVSTGEMSG